MTGFHYTLTLIIILALCLHGAALPTPDEWRESAREQFFSMSKEEIDPYITPLIDHNLSKGLVVVMADQNGYAIYSYGTIKTKSEGILPNETLFDIGSLSKVMTGILMADGEIRGVYNLSSPVNTWLFGEYSLPDFEGVDMTGFDLATHRSGLPASPDKFSEYDPLSSYADQIEHSMEHFQTMTADDTYNWVSNSSMLAPPGYQFLYSNLGAAIAGDTIARSQGVSYPDLLSRQILSPLGMTSTGAIWTLDNLGRRAQGYRGYEYPADEAHLIRFNEFWTATGGIHSNAEDMAVFLAAQMGLLDTELSGAIEKSHIPVAEMYEGPPRSEMGIFWEILHNRDGTTIIKKAGETNAHQAAIAWNPDFQVGVVILSNTATITGTHVIDNAIALLERMQVKNLNKQRGLSG
ncbi:MAG: beta-lactamase family protein [Methanomicrobiales archaeon]|nr:beta-lactamase family protein [Methanomicrobiales archaeon]